MDYADDKSSVVPLKDLRNNPVNNRVNVIKDMSAASSPAPSRRSTSPPLSTTSEPAIVDHKALDGLRRAITPPVSKPSPLPTPTPEPRHERESVRSESPQVQPNKFDDEISRKRWLLYMIKEKNVNGKYSSANLDYHNSISQIEDELNFINTQKQGENSVSFLRQIMVTASQGIVLANNHFDPFQVGDMTTWLGSTMIDVNAGTYDDDLKELAAKYQGKIGLPVEIRLAAALAFSFAQATLVKRRNKMTVDATMHRQKQYYEDLARQEHQHRQQQQQQQQNFREEEQEEEEENVHFAGPSTVLSEIDFEKFKDDESTINEQDNIRVSPTPVEDNKKKRKYNRKNKKTTTLNFSD